MPKLIRLYITHAAIGFGIAGAFVGMLLWFNVANLWHLVSHSDKGVLAVLVLWVANGIVFAGVDADWFQVFLGAMLISAVLVNNFIRKRAEAARR